MISSENSRLGNEWRVAWEKLRANKSEGRWDQSTRKKMEGAATEKLYETTRVFRTRVLSIA